MLSPQWKSWVDRLLRVLFFVFLFFSIGRLAPKTFGLNKACLQHVRKYWLLVCTCSLSVFNPPPLVLIEMDDMGFVLWGCVCGGDGWLSSIQLWNSCRWIGLSSSAINQMRTSYLLIFPLPSRSFAKALSWSWSLLCKRTSPKDR